SILRNHRKVGEVAEGLRFPQGSRLHFRRHRGARRRGAMMMFSGDRRERRERGEKHRNQRYSRHADNGRAHPPYTADTIVGAVTAGVDPAGNGLDWAMPRYTLDSMAVHDLVAYLKRLGSDSDQGAGSKEIVIGAVVPSGGPFAGIGSVVTR